MPNKSSRPPAPVINIRKYQSRGWPGTNAEQLDLAGQLILGDVTTGWAGDEDEQVPEALSEAHAGLLEYACALPDGPVRDWTRALIEIGTWGAEFGILQLAESGRLWEILDRLEAEGDIPARPAQRKRA